MNLKHIEGWGYEQQRLFSITTVTLDIKFTGFEEIDLVDNGLIRAVMVIKGVVEE